MYFYEYTADSDLADRPRQICPFAAVDFCFIGSGKDEVRSHMPCKLPIRYFTACISTVSRLCRQYKKLIRNLVVLPMSRSVSALPVHVTEVHIYAVRCRPDLCSTYGREKTDY